MVGAVPRLSAQSSPEIYLVRRGETEWNSQGRFQGRLDSVLTTKGCEQSLQLGMRLARALASRGRIELHVSPLGWARQTAEILRRLADYGPPVFDGRLQEISLGSWDGLTLVEIDAEWPGRLDGSTEYDWYFRSPDGEGYAEALDRVRAWLAGISGVVIAVSHGLLGRIIRGAYLELPREQALSLPVPHDAIWHLHGGEVQALAGN